MKNIYIRTKTLWQIDGCVLVDEGGRRAACQDCY
jgi:hypothetical protein